MRRFRSLRYFLPLMPSRYRINSCIYLIHLLVVPARASQADTAKGLHFDAVCSKFCVAPLIEDAIANICKDEARVRSLRPAGGIMDHTVKIYVHGLAWVHIL